MNAPAPKGGVFLLEDMDLPKGWPLDRWQSFVADAIVFRKFHGKMATDLGWTPMDLFAVSREAPYALHAWGAVLFIKGRKVSEITANEIFVETSREKIDPATGEVTMDRLRISKRKPLLGAILAWEIN